MNRPGVRTTAWLALASALVAGDVQAAAPGLQATRVDVLDRVDRPATGPWRELSGLDWDAACATLVAVSDRGVLLTLPQPVRAGRLHGLDAARALRIAGEPRVNAESVVAQGGRWWVADEARRRILAVDAQGQVLAADPWPGVLGTEGTQRTANSGVEALARHGSLGWLAVTQRPRAGEPVDEHRVHAQARSWRVPAHGPGRSSIKAADLQGDRLRLLEKWRAPETGSERFAIVELDLAACADGTRCDTRTWLLDDERLAGPNWEGLACLPDGQCLLVSDSGRANPGAPQATPTTLALLRLAPWPQGRETAAPSSPCASPRNPDAFPPPVR